MHKVYKKVIKSPRVEELGSLRDHVGVWINIIDPDDNDRAIIKSFTALDDEEIKTLFDIHERPRIEKNEGTVIIVFHVPAIVEDELETTPLVILVTPNNIITVCNRENQILGDFVNGSVRDFNTTMKTRFTLQLIRRINYYFERNLNIIDNKINAIEEGVLKYTTNKEILALYRIQKTLVYFNTAVVANGKVLKKITVGNFLHLFEQDQELLEDIIIENDQTHEMVVLYNGIIGGTIDTFSSIISNNLNLVLKFLTVVTIVLAIPTVLASLWGMNIPVPWSTQPFAFYLIIGISTFVVGLTSAAFLWRK